MGKTDEVHEDNDHAAADAAAATPAIPDADPGARPLSPEARRALAEAEERRKAAAANAAGSAPQPEVGGRDGPDPVRYGDWEKGGIASDF